MPAAHLADHSTATIHQWIGTVPYMVGLQAVAGVSSAVRKGNFTAPAVLMPYAVLYGYGADPQIYAEEVCTLIGLISAFISSSHIPSSGLLSNEIQDRFPILKADIRLAARICR
ncbi:hypothetical protein B0H11DRAFT_1918808 [Mycena galericulata]|nr:hypothetical protein B0H11DRAFT_1918808 [Mycena galericulata]